MELIFVMAHWHALAKLRMHNDLTLNIMEAVTVSLGKKLRKFSQITCSAFATKELPREYNARIRRCTKKAAITAHKTARTSSSNNLNTASSKAAVHHSTPVEINKSNSHGAVESPARAGRQSKALNLSTYKGHSLGDYVYAIRTYGTTDSYSTEPVRDLYLSFDIIKLNDLQGELEHRLPKSRYTRTSRKGVLKQITQIERRQTRLRRIRTRYRKAGKPLAEDVATSIEAHHVIGVSQNFPDTISVFLQKNRGDPAIKVICIVILFKYLIDAFHCSGLCFKAQESYTSTHQGDASPSLGHGRSLESFARWLVSNAGTESGSQFGIFSE
jgi:hypothetical protein